MVSLLDLKKGKFEYLYHDTTLEKNVIQILKSGYLKPLPLQTLEKGKIPLDFDKEDLGTGSEWGCYPGVYMSLGKLGKNKISGFHGRFRLVFSLNLLHDQSNFHMNTQRHYGSFNDKTYFPEEYQKFSEEAKYDENEVVFHDKVDISKYLKYIIFTNHRHSKLTKKKKKRTKIKKRLGTRKDLATLFTTEGLREFIPLIKSAGAVYKLHHRLKILANNDSSPSSLLAKNSRCIPASFFLDIEKISKIAIKNAVKRINEPDTRKSILKLIRECDIAKELTTTSNGVDLDIDTKFTLSDMKLIEKAVMRKYKEYMMEKYS